MEKLSVIIPARNEPFLNKTVDGLFENAEEEIEIIVMLDGYWPNPPLKKHNNLIIAHNGSVNGLRINQNAASRLATGKYLMKTDAHCIFDKGFDVKLKSSCKKNYIVIPSRYSLNHKTWERYDKPAIEYLYLTYPYRTDEIYGDGFSGRKLTGDSHGKSGFYAPEEKLKDKLIDDIIVFQGSCWFTRKSHFESIGGFNETWAVMWQEALELAFKTWLSGGRVIRNKKTWYAHLHKNKETGGRGFRLSKREMVEMKKMSADYWMNNRWEGQTRDIRWLINKFSPMPEWPENWCKEHKPEIDLKWEAEK